MGKFEQHVAFLIGKRENLVCPQFSNKIGFNANIGPGKNLEWDLRLMQSVLKRIDGTSNCVCLVAGIIATLMRSTHHGRNTIRDSQACHG